MGDTLLVNGQTVHLPELDCESNATDAVDDWEVEVRKRIVDTPTWEEFVSVKSKADVDRKQERRKEIGLFAQVAFVLMLPPILFTSIWLLASLLCLLFGVEPRWLASVE